jgi:uncharacterized protein YgiM (DUF1202 family)
LKRLLILAATFSLMAAGQALCQTTHAAAAVQDTGGSSSGSSTTTVPVSSTNSILTTARQYLGYPYAYIGDDPSTGFSCIGFAHYVFAQSGIYVPEELGQAYGSAPHVDESNLQPGDLVFFQNTVWDGISHVALYVGGGKMIAADSFQTGVQWDNIDDSYWQDHYLGATRPLSNPTGTPLNPPAASIASGPSLTPPGGATLAIKARTVLSPNGQVSVYSGPGSSYATIDALSPDTALTTVQTQGQWVNVSYNGGDQYGWVHGRDLNLPPGADGPATSTAGNASGSSTTQPVSATVTPIASPPVSGTVGSGSPVQIVKGFHATQQGQRVLVVAAPLLYVRAAPDRHARIVRRVHAGDRLRLLGTKSGWDYVAQRDGARGWVNARWVR